MMVWFWFSLTQSIEYFIPSLGFWYVFDRELVKTVLVVLYSVSEF
jgi:hypothetical protein